MPIKPENRSRYPKNWKAIAKTEWRHGLHKKTRFVLTVAHHPDPSPENCDRSNLIALCAPCHLRLDANHHAVNAAATRRRKQEERSGQLSLLGGGA